MTPALAAINLWNPTHITGLAIMATAFVLGMVHGVTPDEHTWPITFSYSIGGYSTRRGLRSGLIFSLAFTLQRGLASELAYLGLAHVFTFASVDDVVYLVVGSLMVAAGIVVVRRRRTIHLHLLGRLHLPGLRSHPAGAEDTEEPFALSDPRPWMAAVHGFVAGWGFGAFALIIYTVLAPAEHSAAWGWVPGVFFGLGTMVVQVLAGGLFGLIAARRGLGPDAIRRVALRTAGNTLTWGGVAFVAGGAIVVQDVPPFCLVQGDRARLVSLNATGLERAGFTSAEVMALRRAYRVLFRGPGALAERLTGLDGAVGHVAELVGFLRHSERGAISVERRAA